MNRSMTPRSAACEPLESRRLLTAGSDFAQLTKAGTLTLVGTPVNDDFLLDNVGTGSEFIRVSYQGLSINFGSSRVIRVLFHGGDGDDLVDLSLLSGSLQTTLFGDAGSDTLIGGSYYDHLFGGVGADLLEGGNQRDTIYGDGGNDRIFGNGFGDQLFGGAGNDRINGGPGADYVNAGRGDDTIANAGGADSVFGGTGSDVGVGLSDASVVDGIESLR